MYSDFMYKLLRIMANSTAFVGVFSAHYDEKTKLIHTSKKLRKKVGICISIYSVFVILIVLKTVKLWMYEGLERNTHFPIAYLVSCLTFLIAWNLINLFVRQPDLFGVVNKMFYYCPKFIGNNFGRFQDFIR